MSKTPNLSLREGTYYFRARVPTKHIAAYGKAMVSVSLYTSDKAIAKLRLRDQRDQLDRELEVLGQQAHKLDDDYQGVMLHLSDADVEHLCLRFRAARMAEDELHRIAGIKVEDQELDLDILGDGVSLLRQNYARGFLGEVYNFFVPCDHVPIRSWPRFQARDVMRGVIEAMRAEEQV